MKRSKHNLSYYNLMTCDMGQIIPIGLTEVLPGDTIQHHANVLIRVSPLAAPVMHPVTARIHHFFVPNRLVWDGWEDFITGGADGNDSSSPPTFTTPPDGIGKFLTDYYGIPLVGDMDLNHLPIRGYNLIFNEFYRDQDLVSEIDITDPNVLAPQNCAWEKDYFTSARPWPQKGPDVTLPLGDQAPVRGLGMMTGTTWPDTTTSVKESGQVDTVYATSQQAAVNQTLAVDQDAGSGYPDIYADLSNATGGNINDIRRAFAIQRYQEARARYGSRYTEYLRYLGVKSADSRLQRPEFLAGGHAQINFSEVLQTAPETGQEPTNAFGVSDMYGHGIAAMKSNKYRRFIQEHGYVHTLLSVRPKSMYTNGVDRTWLRTTKEDYFQKELQYIGQQEVYNNEVYATDLASGMQTFGYQDRYMDYRENKSHACGEFRNTLNYWHMGREFQSAPTLNESFVKCEPTKRIHNEQTMNALWVMAQHKMVSRRILSRSAAPKIF